MNLAIDVEFLHGTFRADPDGLAHTGRMTRGEWPPSPSRVFAALIAADGTGDRCRVTDGSELEFLERLDPPVIHADLSPHHQKLQIRYVVRQRGRAEKRTHQEYVARAGVPVHGGVRVCLQNPHVVYVYETDVPSRTLEALRLRAARVGYLGASDSPVHLRVSAQNPDGLIGDQGFVPDPDGDIRISVPRAGHTRVWDSFHESWCERGVDVARSHYPALRYQVVYRSPGAAVGGVSEGSVAVWLQLRASVSGRRVTAVTTLFKKAVLAQYDRLFGEPPAVLHGHGYDRSGYELARYLALPDAGFVHSRGRIHGLAVWLPPESDTELVQRVQVAAESIRQLDSAGVHVAVHPWAGEARPRAAHPDRWTRDRFVRWATAFPAIHERHGPLTLAEVGRWCAHAGLPEPISFRSDRRPLVHGGVDLVPAEVHRPGRPGRPYSHIELVFAEPIAGPVVVGSGRQRGFGLCVPVTDDSAARQRGSSNG